MTNQDYADRAFMALVLWRECRGEAREGKIAVAASMMNRVQRPSWWGRTVTDVLFKKWQYSSMTDPRDPQLTTWPQSGDTAWEECLDVAFLVLSGGEIENPVPGADSYYDVSLDKIGKPPAWIKTARFVKQIGRLKFYDVDHDYQG